MRAPTFIGIGMQKGGTRWLYEQFQHHPAFRMPPMKEFHFFGRRFPVPKYLDQLERRTMTDPFHIAFRDRLRGLERRRDHPITTYMRLFEGTEGFLTGEITPRYSGLPGAEIDRIADALPETRILLMLRDPVSRAWSALNDAVNAGSFDASCLSDPARLRQTLALPHVAAVSFPGKTYRRWSHRFEVTCIFLEEVSADPAAARRRALLAVGADPEVPSRVAPGHNSKAGRPRAEMSPAIAAALAEHFAADMELAARLIGGPARNWASRSR